MINMKPHSPKEACMLDHKKMSIPKAIDELTPELKKFLNETRSKLKL